MAATPNLRIVPRINWVLAFVWAYHGLVPKLLVPHEDELLMNRALGLGPDMAVLMARTAGIAELGVAACLIAFARHRWPLQLTILGAGLLLAYVVLLVPSLLAGAFNPVTTNTLMVALAWEGLRKPTPNAAAPP